MSGAIGDIRQGIIGISHTSGSKQVEMPADKKVLKPSVGDTIKVHAGSTLNLGDSDEKIKKFIRGEKLESYSPQDQQAIRNSIVIKLQESMSEYSNTELESITQAINLFQEDDGLEKTANMARNILISA